MALYRRFRLAVCVGFASFDAYCAGLRRPRLRWLLRVLVLALLLFTLSLTVLSLFLYGRDDELIRNNSGLFHDVQSWFTLM